MMDLEGSLGESGKSVNTTITNKLKERLGKRN